MIFQIPESSANVVAQLAVGLMPVKAVYYERVLKFRHRLLCAEEGSPLRLAWEASCMAGESSYYFKETTRII